MKNKGELIAATQSAVPIKRIGARVQLLKLFPDNADQELKKDLYFELATDVNANRGIAVDYISGITNLQFRAYAVTALNYGLSVSKRNVPPPLGEQRTYRKAFVHGIKAMANELEQIEDVKSRLEVAKIISREGHYRLAKKALDETWKIGWDTRIPTSLYREGHWDTKTVAESLEDTVQFAKTRSIKKRALHFLSEIPDKREKEKYLQNVMCVDDDPVSVEAVERYVEKVGQSSSEEKSSIALDAMLARKKIFQRVIETASQAAVERAFELYVENLVPGKELSHIYHLTPHSLSPRLKMLGQCYPRGLMSLVIRYFSEHVDEAGALKDGDLRSGILVFLAERQIPQSTTAVDYLAETSKDGVHHIAQLYTNTQLQQHLSSSASERVDELALKFTRKFVNLEDKDLARAALRVTAGWPDESLEAGLSGGKGEYVKVSGTERYFDEIAAEELEKLPKEPSKREKLEKIFS
jgi:hypothetical protein